MANEEQLKILRQGVDAWNEWREEHPEEQINLRKADLRDIKLKKVNLHKAVLIEAILHGADLREANLSDAHLNKADLGLADLQGANMNRSSLPWAYIGEANLHGASLINLTSLMQTWVERILVILISLIQILLGQISIWKT